MLHSVRFRVTFWYSALLAIVLITFAAISYLFLARSIRAELDASLTDTAHEFAAAFANDPHDVLLDFRYSDREILVMNPAGAIVAASRTHALGDAARRETARRIARGQRGLFTVGDVRVMAMPIRVMSTPYVALVARSRHDQTGRLRDAAIAIILGIPVALLVTAGGGYLLARRSLDPAGLLARLDDAIESQRRFMADASHELRTPVSILQGEADVALSRDDRDPAEYREALQVVQKAAQGLTRIVQNLFLLSRADASAYPVNKARFYLDETVGDAVRSMRTIAAARGIRITFECADEVLVDADEELLQRLVIILLDNAVKYTKDGGAIDVTLREEDGRCTLSVRDEGPGVPLADRERIFDRFYRGRRGGAGLGLAIAQWIAQTHGGSVRLADSSPRGSTFVAYIVASSTPR